MNHISIFALGGLDENEKNCYVLEWNEKIFIINAGTKIPINSTNGIDTLIPNFDYLVKNKDRIQGIFISDVKSDTFSALPWLLMQIPNLKIYTSEFNKLMILDRLSKYRISNAAYKIFVLKDVKKFDDIFIQPIDIAGSMPGCLGFDFITPDGDVLFMFNFVEGNLGIYGKLSFDSLAKNFTKRKLLALVVDAGRVNLNGKAIEKIALPQSIKEVFLNAGPKERIIVSAYDEEMASIQQILDLAYKTKRPVVTYGKTYGQVFELIRNTYSKLNWPNAIDYRNANKIPNAVVLVTGSINRLFSRFLRITEKNDVFLSLNANDNVLFLSPAVNGLEKLEALTLDEIAKVTSKIYDVSSSEFYRHRPARQDIIDLVTKTKPQYVIPVEGLYRYLSDAQRYIAKECKMKENQILVLQNGRIAHFIDGKLASSKGKVKEVGETIIDGYGIGDISSEVVMEREVLGREGVIVVSVLFDSKTKKLVSKIQINFVGSISKEAKKDASELIKQVILKILEEEKFANIKELQNRARQVIKRKIFKNYDKEPLVVVTFQQIS
ncbi:ribonuclease J [Mycoplasmopsis columbinasalis]|uniref:Hydrolase n=1 Tax=Mycoplasmopsis columbinasalis TaxID=114880 RepID=A0A449B9R7_9BACT|nr:ribonuclease J [Mycoplasmopsis columbinasalis]VEU77940.1 hydrolase [Mycoplasmopsis columbinasalis]